jgi:hypothetical protein
VQVHARQRPSDSHDEDQDNQPKSDRHEHEVGPRTNVTKDMQRPPMATCEPAGTVAAMRCSTYRLVMSPNMRSSAWLASRLARGMARYNPVMPAPRRFPSPWSIEDIGAAFVAKDGGWALCVRTWGGPSIALSQDVR